MSLLPVTIITGFLGSGKTTLLQRVLTEAHGQKIAVIENEFGSENIDNDILVADTVEQIIQMNNGCVCCTIRDDLRSTLNDLAQKRRKGELDFNRIIVETTGLADPGPVAQTFFMDDGVADNYMLDSIITLVDAKHANQQLDDRLEAQRQVGFADQIFISKADLVSAQELHALQHRLHAINPRASQRVVHFGEVPLQEVLDLKGFNLSSKLELDPDFLPPQKPHGHKRDHHHHAHGKGCGCGSCGCNHKDEHHQHGENCGCGHDHHAHHEHHAHHQHGEGCGCGSCSSHHEDKHHQHGEGCGCGSCNHEGGHHHHAHHHQHDDDVKSFVFKTSKAFDAARLEEFLGAVVQIYGPKMYRYKGVLAMQGTNRKVIFQGVHQLMGSDLGPEWRADEERISKMVFIGVELPQDILQQGLEQCLV